MKETKKKNKRRDSFNQHVRRQQQKNILGNHKRNKENQLNPIQ